EEAAQAGIIPLLKRVIEASSPLKQFALPILCDLASAGKSCRSLLWQHDILNLYLRLLSDQYFQVTALESIYLWLQDETARVEDHLTQGNNISSLVSCFVSAKTNSFENLLDPFLKITRLSGHLAVAISKPEFFERLLDRVRHANKAVVRLNLLRILRVVCDANPNRAALVERFGVLQAVERLSQKDAAVLVRELAREIIPSLNGVSPISNTVSTTPRAPPPPDRRRVRRTASETSFSSLGLSTNSNGSTRPTALAPRHPSSRPRVALRSKLTPRQTSPAPT
ncbi:hypothetical protein FRB99_005949, partial [Tulasnella sp. 403]